MIFVTHFKGKLLGYIDDLRSSFWFLPSLMAVSSIVLSQICLYYDRESGATILNSVFFYTGSADGARSILSTIASSMIGVGGVVFSMTLVTLSLAAQQFGARTLRSLVRDRANQAVLGVFISAFVFCLLVLRQIRGASEGGVLFVPQVSMFVALVFALGGLIVLIYFIHHISFVIQAPHIISEAGADLVREVMEPASGNWRLHPPNRQPAETGQPLSIVSAAAGYVRRVDYSSLAKIAEESGHVITVKKRAGDFAFSGEIIAQANESLPKPKPKPKSKMAASDENKKGLETAIAGAFSFGRQRTQEQDLRFIIGQLLSIALLALSPAVNNPKQAILCIDRLAEALRRFGMQKPRGNFLFSEDGKILVIAEALTFEELFVLSFREIRLNSKTQLMVSLSLLSAYRQIYEILLDEPSRAIVAADYRKLFGEVEGAFGDEIAEVPRTCRQKPRFDEV